MERTCPLRSDCRREADRKIIRDLCKHEWEVFVIKLDAETGKHKWFTECCERLAESIINAGERAIVA